MEKQDYVPTEMKAKVYYANELRMNVYPNYSFLQHHSVFWRAAVIKCVIPLHYPVLHRSHLHPATSAYLPAFPDICANPSALRASTLLAVPHIAVSTNNFSAHPTEHSSTGSMSPQLAPRTTSVSDPLRTLVLGP